ncbi:MAG: hypothetical protein LBG13_01385 [Holosporales bacterium]|jgi:hypothetical protein|nr:hypothetical protein [Holosporales bacterium]
MKKVVVLALCQCLLVSYSYGHDEKEGKGNRIPISGSSTVIDGYAGSSPNNVPNKGENVMHEVRAEDGSLWKEYYENGVLIKASHLLSGNVSEVGKAPNDVFAIITFSKDGNKVEYGRDGQLINGFGKIEVGGLAYEGNFDKGLMDGVFTVRNGKDVLRKEKYEKGKLVSIVCKLKEGKLVTIEGGENVEKLEVAVTHRGVVYWIKEIPEDLLLEAVRDGFAKETSR